MIPSAAADAESVKVPKAQEADITKYVTPLEVSVANIFSSLHQVTPVLPRIRQKRLDEPL
jgi:hypothetical protein